MKKLLTLIISIVIINNLGYTQTCGSIPTQAQIKYLDKTKIQRENYSIYKSKSGLNQVPVQIHVLQMDNGTGGLTPFQISTILNEVNTAYANANMEFIECNSRNYIQSTFHYNFRYENDSLLGITYDISNVINIYLVNTIRVGIDDTICGYAPYPTQNTPTQHLANRILIQNSCAINGSTFIHELGHYFSLYHTHGISFTDDEFVDGSNCSIGGDRLCDTPADPNLYGQVNNSCQYTGNATDANGDTYVPNTHNIMSYSNQSCRTILSNGQYNRIAYSLAHDRNYLTCPGGSQTCNATISTFPYRQNFESFPLCPINNGSSCTLIDNWVNETNEDLDWITHEGYTPSLYTGPGQSTGNPTDFSPGTATGNYLYIESSGSTIGYPNKTAIMNSPCFDLTATTNTELLFAYNMYGSNVGSLDIDVSTNSGISYNNVWNLSGNQGDVWQIVRIDLSNYDGDIIKIRFRATTGASYRSDIAIDDIYVLSTPPQCSEKIKCSETINKFPYTQDFEKEVAQNTDDCNYPYTPISFGWSNVNSSGTIDETVGPLDNNFGNGSLGGGLYGSGLVFDVQKECILDGVYVYADYPGNLTINLLDNIGNTINSRSTTITTTNIKTFIPLGFLLTPGTNFKLTSSGLAVSGLYLNSGASYPYNSASGAVTITGSIPSIPGFYNFFYDWQLAPSCSKDDIDWIASSGTTPTNFTGPNTDYNPGTKEGKYMYIESTCTELSLSKVGILQSPCFDLSSMQNTLFQFAYSMYGGHQGTLYIDVNAGGLWKQVWSLQGNYAKWNVEKIDLSQYDGRTIAIRFRREGLVGPSALSDLAIDDIWIGSASSAKGSVNAHEQSILNKELITLYPNPTNDFINLSINLNDEYKLTYELYDITGRLMKKNMTKMNGNSSSKIDLSGLQKGIYFLNINIDGRSTIRKIIVE